MINKTYFLFRLLPFFFVINSYSQSLEESVIEHYSETMNCLNNCSPSDIKITKNIYNKATYTVDSTLYRDFRVSVTGCECLLSLNKQNNLIQGVILYYFILDRNEFDLDDKYLAYIFLHHGTSQQYSVFNDNHSYEIWNDSSLKTELRYWQDYFKIIEDEYPKEINEIKSILKKKVKPYTNNEVVYSDTTFLNDTTIYVRFFTLNKNDTTLLRTHYFSYHDSKWLINGTTYVYSDNKLNTLINFRLGLQEGAMYFFDKEGKSIELQTLYINDTINGLTITYYPNGRIKQYGKCYNSFTSKYGEWLTYYENGNLKSVGQYGLLDINKEFKAENIQLDNFNFKHFSDAMVVRFGVWLYYDERGNLIKRDIIEEPEIVFGIEHF